MIKFRKLYENSPLDGVYSNAIITYTKRGYYMHYHEIVQWQKRLTIDLWLCVVRFEWLTRVSDLQPSDTKPSTGNSEAQ